MREYNVTLDIHKEDNGINDLWFIQGDVGGKLYFNLLDDGVPIDLSEATVIALFENKQKQVSEKDILITNPVDGEGEVEVTNSILSIPGNIKVDLKIYKGEDLKVTFTPFYISSKKSIPVDDVIYGSTEIDVLQTILDSNKKITQLNIELANTIEKVDNKILILDTELSAKIINLSTDINKNISELDDNIKTVITELSDNVGVAITELNTTLNESIDIINNNLEESIEGVNTTLNESIKNINTNMGALDNAKIDVIVSETEPDILGLKIGTIWIRPKIEGENE